MTEENIFESLGVALPLELVSRSRLGDALVVNER